MSKKTDLEAEKAYSVKQTVAKLRRLADCLEADKPFTIQVGRRTHPRTGLGHLQYRARTGRPGRRDRISVQVEKLKGLSIPHSGLR